MSPTIYSTVLTTGELARLRPSQHDGAWRVRVQAVSGRRSLAGGCVFVSAARPRADAPAPSHTMAPPPNAPAAPSRASTTVITSAPIAGGVSAVPSVPLQWAPPALRHPQVVHVKNGLDPDHVDLDTSQDYILKLPTGGLHGSLEIDGGHNVVLIGGSITVPSTANQTDNGSDDTDQGIYVRASTGVVHIEGVYITGDPNTQFDGVDVNAPLATVQLENIRVDNVWGSDTTEHADVVQTWGGVRDLRIDHLTADGDYQGLTIDPDLGPVGSVEIENVDLTLVPRPAALAAQTVGGGYMIWLTKGAHTCNAPGAVTFQKVFVDDHDTGRVAPSHTIWPPSTGSGLSCAGTLSGSHETWPRLPVTGSVSLTTPPDGAFVPAGIAGDSYVSPGYVAAS